MSKLGKILLWVALVGALVAIGAGVALIEKYNGAKTNLAQANQAKETAVQEAAKEKKAAEDAAQAQADAEKKASDAADKVTDLTTQLATATKQASDAQAALATATTAAQTAQAALDKINQSLGGKTADELVADDAKAQKDLETSESEKKILEDSVQAALAQVDLLKKDINDSHLGIIPPGVSGKVTFVNLAWNFVVLDVGLSNGVVPNGELIVYRGKTFLGKVKVTSAEANSCVADILPDVQGIIQKGDYVLN